MKYAFIAMIVLIGAAICIRGVREKNFLVSPKFWFGMFLIVLAPFVVFYFQL